MRNIEKKHCLVAKYMEKKIIECFLMANVQLTKKLLINCL